MPDELPRRPEGYLYDPELGISIRFIRQFDVERAKRFTDEDIANCRRLQAALAERAERLELEHLYALPSPPEDR